MAGLTEGLAGLFLAAGALVAGLRALSGDITIGELVAVVGLTQFLAEPLGMLGDISAHTSRAHASARCHDRFLAHHRLVEEDETRPVFTHAEHDLRGVRDRGSASVTLSSRTGG